MFLKKSLKKVKEIFGMYRRSV